MGGSWGFVPWPNGTVHSLPIHHTSLRSVTLSSDTRPSITNLISSFQGFIILLLKTRAIIHTNFQFLIIRSQIKNVMALLECCSLETEKMVLIILLIIPIIIPPSRLLAQVSYGFTIGLVLTTNNNPTFQYSFNSSFRFLFTLFLILVLLWWKVGSSLTSLSGVMKRTGVRDRA